MESILSYTVYTSPKQYVLKNNHKYLILQLLILHVLSAAITVDTRVFIWKTLVCDEAL
jgi:hypothetical protein